MTTVTNRIEEEQALNELTNAIVALLVSVFMARQEDGDGTKSE